MENKKIQANEEMQKKKNSHTQHTSMQSHEHRFHTPSTKVDFCNLIIVILVQNIDRANCTEWNEKKKG